MTPANDNDAPALTPEEAHAEQRRQFDQDASLQYWQDARDFYSITTNPTVDAERVAEYARDLVNSMSRLARVRGAKLERDSL